MLGADTRSTAGSTVADKNCEKIHFIAPNIYCCGAGTAADTENVTGETRGERERGADPAQTEGKKTNKTNKKKHDATPTRPRPSGMVSSHLTLHRYSTDRPSRVVTTLTLLKSHLFRYQGHVSAALVLGGVDVEGPHLFTVYPHGSTDALPFATMGSGSLNAMAVFEAGYRDGMPRDAAVALVARAIRAGIYNDLGSGSNVDVCVITKDGVDYLRNHEYLAGRTYERVHPVVYAPGTAAVAKTRVLPAHAAAREMEGEPLEAMEVA